MADRQFQPKSENNGILHPPSCACVRCAAGRDSLELGDSLRQRIDEELDNVFVDMVKGNVVMAAQALGQGGNISVVRSGLLQAMGNLKMVRQMAAEYFAEEKAN